MPVFEKITDAGSGRTIPPEILEEYQGYIDKLEMGESATLHFGPKEDVAVGREALRQAGEASGRYVRVAKLRNAEKALKLTRISTEEYEAARQRAQERGDKIRRSRAANKGNEA